MRQTDSDLSALLSIHVPLHLSRLVCVKGVNRALDAEKLYAVATHWLVAQTDEDIRGGNGC